MATRAALTRTLALLHPSLQRYSLLLSLPLSTTSIPEHLLISSLSSLLPLQPQPTTPNPKPSSNSRLLLSPADRIRGVFLQKLVGKSALESALSAAASGDVISQELLSDVINGGGMSGAAMVAFFHWAVGPTKLPPCIEIYNLLLRALGRRKDFKFFNEIFSKMEKDSILPNLRTVEVVIDSYVAARQVTKAVEFFKILEKIGGRCDLESCNVLLKCLCRRSHVGVACSVFTSMRGKMCFDNVTYSEIIGGWARFGRVDKVERFWTMMLQDGLEADGVAFCYRIEALGRAGRIDDAVEVFEKMGEMGVVRNTRAYTAMISNYISAGNLEKGMEYYKDMLEKDFPPDIEIYRKMIGAFIKVRKVADALEMFDDMLSRGILPDTGLITSFIEPLCSFGPPHAAVIIYKKSRKAGCRISLKAYKILLERLSRFGKSGMVLKMWEEMQESGCSSDEEVYEFIVDGLCNVGKVDAAVSVVKESLRKGFCLGRVVYSKLNNKLLEMNKVNTAYDLFQKVKDARNVANSRNYSRANGWQF